MIEINARTPQVYEELRQIDNAIANPQGLSLIEIDNLKARRAILAIELEQYIAEAKPIKSRRKARTNG